MNYWWDMYSNGVASVIGNDAMYFIYYVKGDSQTKDEQLKPYQDYLSKLVYEFEEIKFTHISKKQ